MGKGIPPAEVPITVDVVRALLRAQHPDLADKPLVVAGEGWDCVMVRVGHELAVRLPRRATAVPLVAVEQRWLPELAPRLPIRVPAPVRTGEPGAEFPWPWTIVPWFPGVAVERADLHPSAAEPLAGFIAALHVPAPDDAPVNSWRGVPLSTRADAVAGWHATLGERDDGLSAEALAHVREIWARVVDVPIDIDPTWLHGDMHPRNVIGHEGNLAAVIDWGDVCRGDRATDLAAVWMLLPTPDARAHARRCLERDAKISDATWERARGWALLFGSILMAAGLEGSDGSFARAGRRILERLREDD